MDKHDIFKIDSVTSYATLVNKMHTDIQRIMVNEEEFDEYRQSSAYTRDIVDDVYEEIQRNVLNLESAMRSLQIDTGGNCRL